ncbi:unnamed protein product [Prorocentrum cordatum]|uniref:Uncharacterized protein n=1 Tax=Prorocentrum cordatum TaxID=2364126 RepID=A0ABN9SL31_9DINO|nr:unnamed protein product [Polarella glacialis]
MAQSRSDRDTPTRMHGNTERLAPAPAPAAVAKGRTGGDLEARVARSSTRRSGAANHPRPEGRERPVGWAQGTGRGGPRAGPAGGGGGAGGGGEEEEDYEEEEEEEEEEREEAARSSTRRSGAAEAGPVRAPPPQTAPLGSGGALEGSLRARPKPLGPRWRQTRARGKGPGSRKHVQDGPAPATSQRTGPALSGPRKRQGQL